MRSAALRARRLEATARSLDIPIARLEDGVRLAWGLWRIRHPRFAAWFWFRWFGSRFAEGIVARLLSEGEVSDAAR